MAARWLTPTPEWMSCSLQLSFPDLSVCVSTSREDVLFSVFLIKLSSVPRAVAHIVKGSKSI